MVSPIRSSGETPLASKKSNMDNSPMDWDLDIPLQNLLNFLATEAFIFSPSNRSFSYPMSIFHKKFIGFIGPTGFFHKISKSAHFQKSPETLINRGFAEQTVDVALRQHATLLLFLFVPKGQKCIARPSFKNAGRPCSICQWIVRAWGKSDQNGKPYNMCY